MSTAKIAGIAAVSILGLTGAGIGGYVYVEKQVHASIENTFAALPQTSPLLTAARYGSYDVDLMADRVQFHDMVLEFDLSSLDKHFTDLSANMSLNGKMTQSHEQVVVTGLWNLVLGSETLEHIDVQQVTFSGNITQTILQPTSVEVNGEEFVQQDATPESATITTTFTGSYPTAQITGLDISALNDAQTVTPMNVKMDGYTAEDMKMALSLKTDVESMSQRLPIPTINVTMSMAKTMGRDISPTYYGLIRYDDIKATINAADVDEAPAQFTMGLISMEDTKLIDLQAVRTTTEIKDLVIDTSAMTDPKGLAMMAMLGIDQINLDMKMHYDFDPDKHTLTVRPFRLGLKQAGKADISFTLAGVPGLDTFKNLEKLQDKPEEAQAELEKAFQDIALDEIAIGYADEGVLKKVIAAQALQMNATPEQLAQAYSQQAVGFIQAAYGEEKARAVQKAVAAFLSNPDALRIQLKGKMPVRLQDLQQDFQANGPNALQAFQLNVTSGAAAQMN